MRKHLSFIILFIISVFISVIIVLNRKNHEIELFRKYIINMDNTFKSFSHVISNFTLYDNLDIINCDLVDTKKENYKIEELVKKGKLFIYLPEIACKSCIDVELEFLNSFFTEKEKKDIIVLSNFESIRELKIFEKSSSFKSYLLLEKDIFKSEELTNNIVIFYLSKFMQASCVFLPDHKNSKINEIYYEAIRCKLREETIQ